MVDKPGRRKTRKAPWAKIGAVGVLALVVVGVGWVVYWNFIFVPPNVYAELDTNFGPVYVELFTSCAPRTVANFENLSNIGFYDNLVWHRIVPGFVIQTGDPNTRYGNTSRSDWGSGGSNQTVPLEVTKCPNLGNYAGYLGMARQGNDTSGLDTGTSQFYIILDNSSNTESSLDGYYTVFGEVISGMKYVCDIAKVPTYGSNSSFDSQPITPSDALLDSISISKSAPVTPQPITQC